MAEAVTVLTTCWKLASAISDVVDRVEQTRADARAFKFLEQKAKSFLEVVNEGLAGRDASSFTRTISSLEMLLMDILQASTQYTQMSDMSRFLHSASTKRTIEGLDERLRFFTETYLIQSTTQLVRSKLALNPNPRSYVFFEISINGMKAGRIVFMLWDEIAPRTTRNFRELATGQHEFGYKGSAFDCVRQSTWIRGGMIAGQKQQRSIYGQGFKPEGHKAMVSKTALLSMSPLKSLVGSYFCINPDTTCNWKTAFGEVVSGMDVLRKMISMTISNQRPKASSCTKSCIHPKDHFIIISSGIADGP